MLRFRALNQESSDESEGEEDAPAITREAQEQHAFSEYRTALSLLREKKIEEAKCLLKGILDGDILPELDLEECAGHPLSVLKYSCLKNMGSILAQQGDYENSLAHFMKAAKLDSNDVMLWYHLGSVALKLHNLELARDAFLEGLNYSPKNWECLNSLITVLYVLQDYMTCLVFISRAFELDFTFIKGHTIRDAILEEYPSILTDSCLKELDVGIKGIKYDAKICREILQEVEELRTARQKKIHIDTIIKYVPMDDPIITMSWIAIGKSLLNQHKVMQQRLVTPLKIVHDPEDKPFEKKQEQKETEPVDNHCNEKSVIPETIPHSGNESENQVEEVADFTSGQENDDGKGRKRRRNSLLYVAQWVWGEKRRSARVRSTVRREAEREECNLGETLQRILPHTLVPSSEKIKDIDIMKSNDDSMDTMDLYKLFENRENAESRDEKNSQHKVENDPSLNDEGYFGTPSEESDVKKFLNKHNYQDIIEIINFFLQELYERWHLTWPEELVFLYIENYKLMRQHIPFPQVLYSSETVEWLEKDGWMTLLYEELALDCWVKERLSEKKTEGSLGRRPVPIQEIGHLELLLSRFSTNHLLHTRLYWLKAHTHLNDGDIETATGCLDPLLRYLENLNEKDTGSKVVLRNCSHNNLISKESVQQLLTALFRNQNLSEVQYLYDEKRYEELIEILKETFNYCQQPGLLANYNNSVHDCPDRATQLAMLMDAFWQLKRYQDCFHWGEACCNEALHKYLNSEEKEQQKWATILEKLLSGMESCVRKAGLGVVDGPRLSRLVPNLIRIMCHQLESPDTLISMPIESVSPWILLQQILEREKEKGRAVTPVDDDDLPAYINILFIAHEFLSRRSWCCSNEGALLLHAMDVVVPRIHNQELQSSYNRIVQGMEQVIFCLYGHPNKKTKLRSPLQDHGVPPVSLTWDHALKLFQFYLPRELPEFDSHRAVSITADVELILKRIIDLVPRECNPAMMVDKMNQFVEGRLAQLPCPPGGYIPLPRQISAVYYLLADYYFKNNEWAKAIQHYLLDVCVNPVRLDSWAGMALARGSQLETKLNSCEVLKSESEFLRHAARVQRCFQQSLKIQPRHLTLWIEYGSFAYMVHSFCSRLLKQETESLSLEMFDLLEKQKEEMLKHAVDCFLAALKVWYGAGENSGLQDERWLYHYMLGKTAEKYNKKPDVYLDHYFKASHFLHINNASYTRKISYNNPQNLSVEALEVFYRIHACILKWLEQNEGKTPDPTMFALFQRCLQAAQQGPFMSRNAKDVEGHFDGDEDKSSVFRTGKWIPNFDEKDVIPKEGLNKRLEDIIRDVMQPTNEFLDKVEDNDTDGKNDMKDSEDVTDTLASDESDDSGSVTLESSPYRKRNVIRSECIDELNPEMKDTEEKANVKDGVISDMLLPTKEETSAGSQDATSEVSDNDDDSSMSVDEESRGKEGDKENATQLEDSPKAVGKSDCPDEVTAVRRSSQESSTTGTTETSGGNSSSSTDDSSSSDDSSESVSSSSDSSEDESEASQSTDAATPTVASTEKLKEKSQNASPDVPPDVPTNDNLGDSDWGKVHEELIQCCIIGLEECVLRFPQHYKSLYRLTHYYFRTKSHRDVKKCRDLLLESYTCSSVPNRPSGAAFQGLFADRKTNNFFNGVWRIPVSEVDRPGNFASHMSRCVSLLMDVLRELKDHGMLLELCLQLRRTPDPDKKYLRDSEREQLSRQALSLALQTLRNCIQEGGIPILLDVYKAYQRVQKHLPAKETIFSSLLVEAYKKIVKAKNAVLDDVLQYCQHQLTIRRNSIPLIPGGNSTQTPFPLPLAETSSGGFLEASALLASSVMKSPYSITPPSRPRGRPPSVSKTASLPHQDESPFYESSSLNARRGMNWLDALSKGMQQQQQQQQQLQQQQHQELQQLHLQQYQQLQQFQQQQQQQQLVQQKQHGQWFQDQRLQEQRLQEQRLQDQKLQEQKLQELKLQEQKLQEQKLQEQRLHEQKLQEQRLHEQKLQEKQLQEQKLQEKQLQEQNLQEQRLQDQKLQEHRLQDQKLQGLKLLEQKLLEQKLLEQKLQEQKLPEQRLHEQKLQEQRLQEQKLQEQQLQEQKLLEHRLQEQKLQEQSPEQWLKDQLREGKHQQEHHDKEQCKQSQHEQDNHQQDRCQKDKLQLEQQVHWQQNEHQEQHKKEKLPQEQRQEQQEFQRDESQQDQRQQGQSFQGLSQQELQDQHQNEHWKELQPKKELSQQKQGKTNIGFQKQETRIQEGHQREQKQPQKQQTQQEKQQSQILHQQQEQFQEQLHEQQQKQRKVQSPPQPPPIPQPQIPLPQLQQPYQRLQRQEQEQTKSKEQQPQPQELLLPLQSPQQQLQQIQQLQQQLQQLHQLQLQQEQQQKLSLNKVPPKPANVAADYNALRSLFSDPNFLASAMKGKMIPGIESQYPQLAYDFYQAQLSQTLCQLAHNLSLPQVPPNLFGPLSGMPFTPNQLNPTSFKLDCELPSSQATSSVSDYVKDRPNISITPISHSNTVKLKNTSSVSASSASVNNSRGNFGTSLLEKSSRTTSTYIPNTSSGSSSTFKDSKYSNLDTFSGTSFKNKELLLSTTGIQNQGLTISPSTSVINVSASKSSGYKKSYSSQGNASKSGFTLDTFGKVSSAATESKSGNIPISKVEHKSVINSGPGPRSLTSNLHVNPDITVSSQSGSLSLFPQRSKDLQIIPMTSADNPISIHPISSNYKQTPNFNTDISVNQEEELDLSVNYSPPVKKVKDSVCIMEVPRMTATKVPPKQVPPPVKKEEAKAVLGSDVEVITLE